MLQLYILLKNNIFCLCLRHYQLPDRIHHLIHAELGRIQFHLSALDLRHIQDIVNQAQQVSGG